MKKVILIICLLLLTGCGNKYDEEYYMNYSDTVVSFFRNKTYDSSSIYEEDIEALNNYLTSITHENEKIDIEEFLMKDDPSPLTNSSLVMVEGDKCYIKYSDLRTVFDNYNNTSTGEEAMEAYYSGVCKGYPFIIYESDLLPSYEDIVNDPRYDYVLLKDEKKKDEYIFYYRSTYDGTGLQVTLKLKKKHVVEVKTDFVNVDGIIQGEK